MSTERQLGLFGAAPAKSRLPYDICRRKSSRSTRGKRRDQPRESYLANEKVHPSKYRVRAQVLEWIRSRGSEGATADEVAAHFECSPNHTAPRISELKVLGELVDARDDQGQLVRRKTRGGCWARVLVCR